VPTPDGISFLVAENESVVTLHDFAGEDEVSFALLDDPVNGSKDRVHSAAF